eukprot:3151292-Pleurochrysis_carterae.AAC.2
MSSDGALRVGVCLHVAQSSLGWSAAPSMRVATQRFDVVSARPSSRAFGPPLSHTRTSKETIA